MSGQRKNEAGVVRVSERDWEIYQRAKTGRWTQREIGEAFQLSPSRTSAIIARVHKWVNQRDSATAANRESDAAEFCVRHIERLESLYAEALRAWEDSELACVTLTVTEVKGEPIRQTRTIKTQPRDPRWLSEVMKIARSLEEFRNRPKVRAALAYRTVDAQPVGQSAQAPHSPAPTDGPALLSADNLGAISGYQAVISP
jgi:hypothetical protein